MISYNTDGVDMPKIKKRTITSWIRAVAATYGRRVGDVGYLFVNDEKMLEMNREYLGHDYYTDVITFDYDEDDIVSGDIIISLDTVKSNAELYAKSYDEELHRVIIHGILHLCGINDKGPGEREIMERAENRALAMRICPDHSHGASPVETQNLASHKQPIAIYPTITPLAINAYSPS